MAVAAPALMIASSLMGVAQKNTAASIAKGESKVQAKQTE